MPLRCYGVKEPGPALQCHVLFSLAPGQKLFHFLSFLLPSCLNRRDVQVKTVTNRFLLPPSLSLFQLSCNFKFEVKIARWLGLEKQTLLGYLIFTIFI